MQRAQLLASASAKQVLKLLDAPEAAETELQRLANSMDPLPSLPIPPSDRDMLIMRRDDQAKELLRLVEILQQPTIVDVTTKAEVPRDQMLARARAMSRRLMRTTYALFLDELARGDL